MLLLSTVFQLMLSMYSSMKLSDVEALLNCMHDMYDKAHRVVQAALQGEEHPSPTELDEALHLQLEAARYFLEVLLDLFGKMGPAPRDDAAPSKASLPPLGSAEHVLLVASTAEHRLLAFGAHVLTRTLTLTPTPTLPLTSAPPAASCRQWPPDRWTASASVRRSPW